MTITDIPKVWLAYVPYPVTAAVYLESALRKSAAIVTVGPPFPEKYIEEWHLQNLKQPYFTHDIVTCFNPDMESLIAQTAPEDHPDLYLWVESVGGYYPERLNSITCLKACYLIDTHLNLPLHLLWAEKFDCIFLAQREYLPYFTNKGLNAHWLPLACDPGIHAPVSTPLKHNISFVGSLSPRNPRRQKLLELLQKEIGIYCERCWWDDMARAITESGIIFNNAVNNDLNMRVFEVMSIGAMLLTDPAQGSGLDTLFINGEDLAIYRSDDELIDVVRFYQSNPALREQIAARGQQLVRNAHTYAHRVEDLLAVALNGKTTTFSAEELRESSLSGIVPAFVTKRNEYIAIGNVPRSFVIPVLDYSPASEYNITTLLSDLENIPGEVIVIFNNEQVAEEIKGHPRITRYAIMKENIGVARAWNVGIQMAATPVVFILNADLHLQREAVEAVEHGLLTLDRAACVGPQGSFVDIPLTRDHLYFDKGHFDQPIAVDAVSGFFFAIKLEHFANKILTFENAYTPCYFEEWDLGLQIKRAGLASYIIPTTAYDHHWSGSIRALREIGSYGRSETAGEILLRNRQLFLNKWRYLTAAENRPELLESGWREFGPAYAINLLQQKDFAEAQRVLYSLRTFYPDQPQVLALTMALAMIDGDMKSVASHGKRLHLIAPEYDLEGFLRSSGIQP
jgi:glycosyltransferase involved in cell wall biosynthesis